MDQFLADATPRAHRMATMALRDRDEAWDVVNDSARRLVEHYAAKPPGEWRALFFTIVQNRINDTLRHRRVHEARVSQVVTLHATSADDERSTFEPPADRRTEPDVELSRQELGEAVTEAVAALPWSQRQVFMLREWQGLTVREAAQVLGCSENVIKQHHFRALRSLRSRLQEVWDHV